MRYVCGTALLLITYSFLIGKGQVSPVHANTVSTQETDWTIRVVESRDDRVPLDILSLTAGEETVSFQQQKTMVRKIASNEWLRGARVLLVNTSGKTITAVTVEFRYYPDDSRRSVFTEAYKGRDTAFPGNTPDTWIRPGETVEIALHDLRSEILSRAIEARSANVGRLELEVIQAAFDGLPDLIWRRGYLMRRDPNEPRHFIRTDKISSIRSPSKVVPVRLTYSFVTKAFRSATNQACWALEGIWVTPCSGDFGCFGSCVLVDDQVTHAQPGSYFDDISWDYCRCQPSPENLCFSFEYHVAAHQCV